MLRQPNKIAHLIWTEEMGHWETHRALILCKTAGQNDCAALEDTATCCQHHFAASVFDWMREKEVTDTYRGDEGWFRGVQKGKKHREKKWISELLSNDREINRGNERGEIPTDQEKSEKVRKGEVWDKEWQRRSDERGGNADGHVSMGAQERFGVRESCIIAAGQWKGSVKMFKGSVLATAE